MFDIIKFANEICNMFYDGLDVNTGLEINLTRTFVYVFFFILRIAGCR